MPISQWSPLQLQQQRHDDPQLQLLDVREPHEVAFAAVAGSICIPLQQLPQRYNELKPTQPLAVICHHGVRSQQACLYLEHLGFSPLYNIEDGIDAWSRLCDTAVPRY
jgi:rhodanese-related sulfurtransferase